MLTINSHNQLQRAACFESLSEWPNVKWIRKRWEGRMEIESLFLCLYKTETLSLNMKLISDECRKTLLMRSKHIGSGSGLGPSGKKPIPGIILWMYPANERPRYTATSSLIGWAHTQNDPCITWFNTGPDQSHHMASWGHNESSTNVPSDKSLKSVLLGGSVQILTSRADLSGLEPRTACYSKVHKIDSFVMLCLGGNT